jgi:hypothetical protein
LTGLGTREKNFFPKLQQLVIEMFWPSISFSSLRRNVLTQYFFSFPSRNIFASLLRPIGRDVSRPAEKFWTLTYVLTLTCSCMFILRWILGGDNYCIFVMKTVSLNPLFYLCRTRPAHKNGHNIPKNLRWSNMPFCKFSKYSIQ